MHKYPFATTLLAAALALVQPAPSAADSEASPEPVLGSTVATPDPSLPAPEPTAAAPEPSIAADDTRIEDLRALVPEDFAGLPLRETLQLAIGEELAGRMEADERAVFEAMLEAAGKDYHDYVVANAVIRLNETDALVIQPHRVVGIDAQGTTDAWLEILGLNAQRPRIVQQSIAGRDVYLVSDEAQPAFPRLHVFAAGDVVWMVAVEDDAVAAEAVRVLGAASDPGETRP